jgi:hypothetical protein
MVTFFKDDDDSFALAAAPGDKPSWNDAIRGPDREKWLAACEVKVTSIARYITQLVV